MCQLLHLLHGTVLLSKQSIRDEEWIKQKPFPYKITRKICKSRNQRGIKSLLQGKVEVGDRVRSSHLTEDNVFDGVESGGYPPIHTISRIPEEQLVGKVVLVRFDSTILLGKQLNQTPQSVSSAFHTIKHLNEAGAKVILASNWSSEVISNTHTTDSIEDALSSVLENKVMALQCLSSSVALKRESLEKADIFLLENLSGFKEEVANCPKFAKLLSSGVDVFVNDAFSTSHKILASTIGITRFSCVCAAGFYFEECLLQLQNAIKSKRRPHASVIGGGNLSDKASAVKYLASISNVLIFVGTMSFQIMHALGEAVPPKLLERGSYEAARDIIQIARDRNVSILCPKDFACVNDCTGSQELICTGYGIPDGWMPIDLGPVTLEEINSVLKKCKKVTWIGPVKFKFMNSDTKGASRLAQMLHQLSQNGSDVTVIGNMACNSVTKEENSITFVNKIEDASVAWEFLKGRKLPGVMALDRAFPHKIDWNAAYCDPTQPLVVDIGSGNGRFILGMAEKRKDLNFLGLEIYGKLVERCIDSVNRHGLRNGHFIATNATSTFRTIVSSYPGRLVLASIQCPNPDLNKPEHRWRMLQRSLIEAIADLLVEDGKVFLQSDIEGVALRMKEELLRYSKGELVVVQEEHDSEANQDMSVMKNPFGVRSDWEQHVLDRGDPMFRLTLNKSRGIKRPSMTCFARKA